MDLPEETDEATEAPVKEEVAATTTESDEPAKSEGAKKSPLPLVAAFFLSVLLWR